MTASSVTERPGAPADDAPSRRPTIEWGPALAGAVRKLDPRGLVRQPVVFTVWVGSVFSTVLSVVEPTVFGWAIAIWLWLTVLFANVAEAVAEGRGKAQAASLRKARTTTVAVLEDGREVPAADLHPVTGWSWSPARSSRATATSSRASPASTSRPSPASPRR